MLAPFRKCVTSMFSRAARDLATTSPLSNPRPGIRSRTHLALNTRALGSSASHKCHEGSCDEECAGHVDLQDKHTKATRSVHCSCLNETGQTYAFLSDLRIPGQLASGSLRPIDISGESAAERHERGCLLECPAFYHGFRTGLKAVSVICQCNSPGTVEKDERDLKQRRCSDVAPAVSAVLMLALRRWPPYVCVWASTSCPTILCQDQKK